MLASAVQLTEKYRVLRSQPEPLFLSRKLQTFFGRFTKKGKKSLARKLVFAGLRRLRMSRTYPLMDYKMKIRRHWPLKWIFTLLFARMRIPMYLPYRRVGKIMEPAPTPVRRNRRDILNMHLIYTSIKTRPEKGLVERVEGGFLSMNSSKFRSPEQRKQTQTIRRLYDERVNLDFRWK